MTKYVMETVTFKLAQGVSREGFAAAAQDMTDWLSAQPGFLRRRLSVSEDGTWVEQVEWASMADDKAAAAAIGTAPGDAPFLKSIDGPSVRMRHSEIDAAVN